MLIAHTEACPECAPCSWSTPAKITRAPSSILACARKYFESAPFSACAHAHQSASAAAILIPLACSFTVNTYRFIVAVHARGSNDELTAPLPHAAGVRRARFRRADARTHATCPRHSVMRLRKRANLQCCANARHLTTRRAVSSYRRLSGLVSALDVARLRGRAFVLPPVPLGHIRNRPKPPIHTIDVVF